MLRFRLKRECIEQLRHTFGLSAYRPGQKAAIHALISGRDVMCVFPTGSGKSLCWQIPASVHQGFTLVISPLIALMRDQVMHLKTLGLPAVSIDSMLTPRERDDVMKQIRCGTARIAFVSPERLEQATFRQLCAEVSPWLVVVDEAHCVVQWGEGFRPAYRQIAQFIERLHKRPVICALTATADISMQKEISSALGMRRVRRILLPTIRENLRYEVRTTLQRHAELTRLIVERPCKTVVFCRTRARTEELAGSFGRLGISAASYHAGLDRQERIRIQTAFQTGESQVLCATTAFGMGIDFPDIRRVIHDEMPDSLIDYVQQTGRGGRDGLPTECILFFAPNDLLIKAGINGAAKERYRGRPIRKQLYLNKYWRGIRQMLQIMFSASCIPQSIGAAFGSRLTPCGQCSACRRGKRIARVPSLAGMKPWQIRYWLLSWQREALAAALHRNQRKVISDRALVAAAKKMAFPPDMIVPVELTRLVEYFRSSAS